VTAERFVQCRSPAAHEVIFAERPYPRGRGLGTRVAVEPYQPRLLAHALCDRHSTAVGVVGAAQSPARRPPKPVRRKKRPRAGRPIPGNCGTQGLGTSRSENLFLRKQLACYLERQVRPHRTDNASRITLVALSRLVEWRDLLAIVRPETLVRWHRNLSRLFWRVKSRRRGRPRDPRPNCSNSSPSSYATTSAP
jgi:hypothetical protein